MPDEGANMHYTFNRTGQKLDVVGEAVAPSKLNDSRWRAITAIAVLQVVDLVSTYTAIRWAGASEGNLLIAWLVETGVIIPVKAGVVGVMVWCARRTPPTLKTVVVAWWVVGVYSMVAVYNTMHVWSAR